MTAAEVSALRALLARGRSAGWNSSTTYPFGHHHRHDHLWRMGRDLQVELYDGVLTIVGPTGEWRAPARSVPQVTAVLVLAGALPDGDDELRGFERVVAGPYDGYALGGRTR